MKKSLLVFCLIISGCGESDDAIGINDDSLENHAFTSKSELDMWSFRATNGPFKDSDDAFIGSPGSYSRITAYSDLLSTYEDDVVITGSCLPLDSDDSSSMLSSTEFGRFDIAMQAAFVDFVEGTDNNTSTLKSLLLQQAQMPCMDFSNRLLYPYDNKDGVWLYAEWLHKVLLTYDYLGSDAFTAYERDVMDNWFKSAADWFDYIITDRSMDNIYELREGLPNSYEIDFDYWANTGIGSQSYKNSTVFHPPGSWINNRQLGIANLITYIGVMYNNDEWKEIGAQLVREYIAFHFDQDGYYSELNRSIESSPTYGLAYGANSLVNIAEIAHILHFDGYTNLFEFETSITINPDSGDIITGSVSKSLEWVLLSFRENFMLSDAPAIYPRENTIEDSTNVIHLCLNDGSEYASQVVGRFYSSAAILNSYYNNPLIQEMYASEYGNICGVVANEQIRHGPHSVAPSFLFQYAASE